MASGALGLGVERLPALAAEFARAGLGAAVGAEGGLLLGEVEAVGLVHQAGLLPHLVLGRGGLGGGDFFLQVRGAFLAQPALGVPAGLGADPLAAPAALLEVLLASATAAANASSRALPRRESLA